MIFRALTILRQELLSAIVSQGGTSSEVVLGNIALSADQGNTALNDKLILSLVGIEEETTLRNTSTRIPIGDGFAALNPPLHINMHVLLGAHYTTGTGTTPYENALQRLSQAVTFFQGKSVYTLANSPIPSLINDPELQDLKLTIELQTLGLEQTNQLWGALGGRMIPAALYKVRMVAIQANRRTGTGPTIEEIQSNETIL